MNTDKPIKLVILALLLSLASSLHAQQAKKRLMVGPIFGVNGQTTKRKLHGKVDINYMPFGSIGLQMSYKPLLADVSLRFGAKNDRNTYLGAEFKAGFLLNSNHKVAFPFYGLIGSASYKDDRSTVFSSSYLGGTGGMRVYISHRASINFLFSHRIEKLKKIDGVSPTRERDDSKVFNFGIIYARDF